MLTSLRAGGDSLSATPNYGSPSSSRQLSMAGSDSSYGDEEYNVAVAEATLVLSIVSLAGCLFVMGSIVSLRKLGMFHWRTYMSCTASQAIVAFSLMCNYFIWTDERLEESSPVCSFLAFLLTAFNLTTSLWVLVMSIIVHRTAIRVSKEECIEEVRLPLEIFMHALVWPFGLIIASIPLWSVSGVCYVELLCGWCWIDSEPWYARFVYTYMIEWIAIGVTIVLYAHVGMMLRGLLWVSFFKLHKHPHNNHAHRKALLALRQTIVYPLAMVLVWVPCSVARIIEAVNGHDDLHTSQAIAVILPCGGLFLFIAYVLTADLRSDCRTKCCHLKSYNAMNYNTSDLQKHY